jgi:hypothetical protein
MWIKSRVLSGLTNVPVSGGWLSSRNRASRRVCLFYHNAWQRCSERLGFTLFFNCSPALMGIDLLSVEVWRSQAHHARYDSSGRGIGPSQKSLPDNTQHSQETDIPTPGGIWTRNPSKRTAADPSLRPRGHWDRHSQFLCGAFAKLRKATISFVMSVRPSTWNNSAPTGRIFIKFDIYDDFSKIR